MGWKTRLAGTFIRMLDMDELWELSGEAIQCMQTQLTPAERVAYLQAFVEAHAEGLLSGMGREERARLMNGLLPFVVREFPLGDLDILGVFAQKDAPSEEDKEVL
ncbi:MAG: hypothetical protein J7M34_09140 [Anaerolineae bacterium]|nr:hypothetical protein [Anaerolineae bacterium]